MFVAGGACKAGLAAVYDEGVSGELSGIPAFAGGLALTPGATSVIGTIGGPGEDGLDFITLTVPAGMTITAFVNAEVSGTTNQGLLGFHAGPVFAGSTLVAGSYAGLCHFGLNASNAGLGSPSGAATSTVGVDLLPILNSEGTAVGAQGFGFPPSEGTYAFVIGEITASDAEMAYRFDVRVGAVPEAGVAGPAVLAGAGVVLRRRR